MKHIAHGFLAAFFVATIGAISMSATALAQPRTVECPAQHRQRTPEQVLADHRAALAAGDVELDVQCNYDADAIVISDQGVDRGRDAIRQSLLGLVNFFGGAMPMVHDEVAVTVLNPTTHIARLLFSVTTECVDVPDGVDTYLIRQGVIHAQTAHGFPVFKCAPPN
jgi:hypothetical protein